MELVVTMAIFSLLAAIATPSLSSFVTGQRSRSAASEIYSALDQTRSNAIKTDSNITLSPLSGGWQAGWQITNASGTVLAQEPFNGITVTSASTSVVYGSAGRVMLATTSPTFLVSNSSQSEIWCVSVSLSGTPSMKNASC